MPDTPQTTLDEGTAERAGRCAYFSEAPATPPADWSWRLQRAWMRGWGDAMRLEWSLTP